MSGAGVWHVLYAFCRCYHQQLPSQYLLHCVSTDDWLAFLAHALLHQFPLEQVACRSSLTRCYISSHSNR